MRFRTYLFYLLALTITVPFIVLSCTQYFMIKHEVEKENVILRQNAHALANNLSGRIEAATALVTMAANVLRVEGAKEGPRLSHLLADLNDSMPEFLNVHFDNAQGVSIAFYPLKNSEGQSNVGQDHTGRDHWQHIRGTQQVYISNVIEAVGSARGKIVNIAAPAISSDGKVIGYAVSALNLKELARRVLDGIPTKEYVVWILDGQGKPIYANDRENLEESVLPPRLVKEHLEAGLHEEIFSRENASDLEGVVEPLPKLGWIVGCFKKSQDKEVAVFSMIATNTVIFLLVLLLTFLIASVASRKLTQPINLLMRQIRSGKLSPGKDEKLTSPSELVELQKAYFSMGGKLRATRSELSKLQSRPNTTETKGAGWYKEQEAMMNALLKVVQAGVVVTDSNSFVRFYNASSKQLIPGLDIGSRLFSLLNEVFISALSEEQWVKEGKVVFKNKKSGDYVTMQKIDLPDFNGEKVAFIFRRRNLNPEK